MQITETKFQNIKNIEFLISEIKINRKLNKFLLSSKEEKSIGMTGFTLHIKEWDFIRHEKTPCLHEATDIFISIINQLKKDGKINEIYVFDLIELSQISQERRFSFFCYHNKYESNFSKIENLAEGAMPKSIYSIEELKEILKDIKK